MNDSRFYLTTCQIGVEKNLKSEISSYYPELRFAFSRPGFITFKQDSHLKPVTHPGSIFARLWGEVVFQSKVIAEVEKFLETLPKSTQMQIVKRDSLDSSELQLNTDLKQVKKNPDCWVVQVDDSHFFVAKPLSGSQVEIVLPEKSPSRAYLKIAEAFAKFDVKKSINETVLEIGCSPGGATTFLLDQGFKVVGIDPKMMDPKIHSNPKYRHIQKCAINVTEQDLMEINPDIIVLDMNLAPLETLDELRHVISTLSKVHKRNLKIRKGFLTIKLNDLKFSEHISFYLKKINEIGFDDLTPTQLQYNRQEFFVYCDQFKRF